MSKAVVFLVRADQQIADLNSHTRQNTFESRCAQFVDQKKGIACLNTGNIFRVANQEVWK